MPRRSLPELAGQRGVVVLGDVDGAGARPPAAAEVDAARSRAARHGGGLLVDAVRADPGGVVRRILARWAWAPSLVDAADLGRGAAARLARGRAATAASSPRTGS